MKYFIKQGIIIPIFFFIPVIIAGILVPNYDAVKQQASEITISNIESAINIINTGALLTGLSCFLLAFGIILKFKKFYISSILLTIFGFSMISNGIYPMGTIMHGFYGIGLTLMILPFIVCYELKNENISKLFFKITLISGFIIFFYLWSQLVGLDPNNYKGLTQRIASVFIFGWIGYFAFELSKNLEKLKGK